MTRSIPVLYYHRIGAPDPAHLSTNTEDFARQMAFLARRGIRTLTINDVIAHISGSSPCCAPAVMITFDDGFRDNLTNAFPILQANRQKAVLFAATGLIRPAEQTPVAVARGFNEAHTAARRGDFGDFLSQNEFHTLVKSGIFEIHSHGHAHEQVFISSHVTGIYPTTDTHWGILSAYRNPLQDGVWPVFERKPGLTQKAFRPDISRIREIMRRFPQHDLPASTVSSALPTSAPVPALPHNWDNFLRSESDNEFRNRIRDDLVQSFELVKPFHPQGCQGFCMPWGADGPELQAMLRETGYNAAFLTRSGANLPGDDPFRIRRFPIKKASLARFAFGIWLRSVPALARVYGCLHGRL
ncbi:MAG: polysaccharide deacetylase family protein [Candidatus Ozemobacteraceae bacterium]